MVNSTRKRDTIKRPREVRLTPARGLTNQPNLMEGGRHG
jgi:hypothetical protein